jgi:trehalose/maltose hydrolase-like predicted phosphorylase
MTTVPARRVEAVVASWNGAPAGMDRLPDLVAPGLDLYLSVAGCEVYRAEAGELRLAHRWDPDGDPAADPVRWALADLRARGVWPGLVHVLDGTDPHRLLAVLADQVDRRRRGEVPAIDDDPAWVLGVDGLDPELERVHESLLSIADGCVGTRGAPLLAHPAADAAVFAAGAYTGTGPGTELAACPDWTALPGPPDDEQRLRRRLDLRTGVLHQEGSVTAVRFAALSRPGTVVLRARADLAHLPASGRRVGAGGRWAALADLRDGDRLDRIGVYAADERAAQDGLAAAEAAGFDRLIAEQRAAWARRWDRADIVIDGDRDLQFAIRFALFHLMSTVADRGEAPVGARGLSGRGYRGHVFWDSDVFVLPFLAATHPAAARAMLEYRIRRLDAARAAAARHGLRGARFPWESAADGTDVTPTFAALPDGQILQVRTGDCEEHITADVAWAATCYLDWTDDAEFAAGPGREILLETARYWASRIRVDPAGRGHIYGVIGPDEYHEPVDDNAFTNVMARWNLKRAAELDGAEAPAWRQLAAGLVDGLDPTSRIYEQFAGFFDLEPLLIADIAPRRPISAELLLGPQRTREAQVVKQADVLMLHHLVPDEVAADSLGPNLDFYEPRTAHGSSLSPAVHASLLARAGRFREALAALRIAARIDLDDLTGTTAGGLHLATMGSLWQALTVGFAGVRPRDGVLVVDPRLPPQWRGLHLRLTFRGCPFTLHIDHRGVELETDGALALHRRTDHWEVSRA